MEFFITQRRKVVLQECDSSSIDNTNKSMETIGLAKYLHIKIPSLLKHVIDSYKFDIYNPYRCLYSNTVCAKVKEIQYVIPLCPYITIPLNLYPKTQYFIIVNIWYKNSKTGKIVSKIYSQFYTLDKDLDAAIYSQDYNNIVEDYNNTLEDDNSILDDDNSNKDVDLNNSNSEDSDDNEFINITKDMTVNSRDTEIYLERSTDQDLYWEYTVGRI
tara:strand:- start:724 stop:1368 length:645 start_codon:yes stop_codon:yes gene_type:complete